MLEAAEEWWYIGAPLRPGRVIEALFGLLRRYSSEGRMWSREKVGLWFTCLSFGREGAG